MRQHRAPCWAGRILSPCLRTVPTEAARLWRLGAAAARAVGRRWVEVGEKEKGEVEGRKGAEAEVEEKKGVGSGEEEEEDDG